MLTVLVAPTDPKKEICRLKLNWLFMTIIAALYAISYTSVSSSFHQFITNPREENINRSLPETREVYHLKILCANLVKGGL